MDDIPRKRFKIDNKIDESYFRSYADINIHEQMIADTSRTMAYRLAILRNYESIRGKVVIDVGAGTGILSVFCVQAGAKKVYAVEASNIAEQCRLVVAENNMQERITVIQGKVEEIDIPEKADVIVSEWMGYFLLYETMLPSVLYARDKWLKQGGMMLPGSATLYLAPFNDPEVEERLSFWSDVETKYKVKMTSMIPLARKCVMQRVQVHTVPSEDIMAHAAKIGHLNLSTVSLKQLQHITGSFELRCFGHSCVHGLVAWFKVDFPKEVTLNTSPYEKETHWCQSILYLDHPLDVKQDTLLKGSIELIPNDKNHRFMDVKLEYAVDEGEKKQTVYLMDDMIS